MPFRSQIRHRHAHLSDTVRCVNNQITSQGLFLYNEGLHNVRFNASSTMWNNLIRLCCSYDLSLSIRRLMTCTHTHTRTCTVCRHTRTHNHKHNHNHTQTHKRLPRYMFHKCWQTVWHSSSHTFIGSDYKSGKNCPCHHQKVKRSPQHPTIVIYFLGLTLRALLFFMA